MSGPNPEETHIGRVKWFNNKNGYGFISLADNDIFVHHSGIIVSSDQYKYLVQGEYVSFNIERLSSGNHEIQATNVKGINNGKLMCETRSEISGIRRQTRQQGNDTRENGWNVAGRKRNRVVSV
jgi:CspA family cold shock protein